VARVARPPVSRWAAGAGRLRSRSSRSTWARSACRSR
jgi:hypothetical protein